MSMVGRLLHEWFQAPGWLWLLVPALGLVIADAVRRWGTASAPRRVLTLMTHTSLRKFPYSLPNVGDCAIRDDRSETRHGLTPRYASLSPMRRVQAALAASRYDTMRCNRVSHRQQRKHCLMSRNESVVVAGDCSSGIAFIASGSR